MLPPTMTIPKMTRAQSGLYERMLALAEEKSRLNARIQELEKEKKEAEQKLLEVFGERQEMRVSARRIIQRKEIVVAEKVITMKGYSYFRWQEVEG